MNIGQDLRYAVRQLRGIVSGKVLFNNRRCLRASAECSSVQMGHSSHTCAGAAHFSSHIFSYPVCLSTTTKLQSARASSSVSFLNVFGFFPEIEIKPARWAA